MASNSGFSGNNALLSVQKNCGHKQHTRYGGVSCHRRTNAGGNEFRVLGVFNGNFRKRTSISRTAPGPYNMTRNEIDRHSFKVPSLRMAKHTSSFPNRGPVRALNRVCDEDQDALVAFSRSAEEGMPGAGR